jgi:hemoglobin-like flavoprotein
MTPKQIEIVQSQFAKVAPISDVAASLFYTRLFDIDPSLRKLFKGDMKKQGGMLMSMIGNAVRGLTNPNALIPVLTGLGRRHAGYGVVDAHYTTVAQALLWTLEQGLGEEFNAESKDAWVAAYTMMAGVMQQGAKEIPIQIAA